MCSFFYPDLAVLLSWQNVSVQDKTCRTKHSYRKPPWSHVFKRLLAFLVRNIAKVINITAVKPLLTCVKAVCDKSSCG